MPYDNRDDNVFEVAEAVNGLATSLSDHPLPNQRSLAAALGEQTKPDQMTLDEMTRIARVAQSISTEDEAMLPIARSLETIRSDFADGKQDLEGSTLDLRDVLRNVRQNYSSQIVYEGIDVSDHDERFRRDHRLPGEKVSIAMRDDGHPAIDASAGLGDEPLVVSGLFVRGERHLSTVAYTAEYEFEGHEGRHDAGKFHAENGQDHAYGVLMMRDERMFLVPLTLRIDGEGNEVPFPAGATREAVGGAGRSTFRHLHPDGFQGLVKAITPDGMGPDAFGTERGPIVGDINFDTMSKGDRDGPVRLAGMGWSSEPSDRELETATRQIDEFIRAERHEAVREEIQAASDAYRKGRPDSGHGEPGFVAPREHAETAAFNEARHLMREHEGRPDLSYIVSEIATSNRTLKEGGDLGADSELLQRALDMEFGRPGMKAVVTDQSMAGQAAKAFENAPAGVSEAVGVEYFSHVIGKGSLGNADTAKRMDEIAAASVGTTTFAVADTPMIAVGSDRKAEGRVEWSAIDLTSGATIRDGIQSDAASIMGTMKATQKTLDGFEGKRGIMAQADAVAPSTTPAAAKGGNDQSALAAMSAALGKSGKGR